MYRPNPDTWEDPDYFWEVMEYACRNHIKKKKDLPFDLTRSQCCSIFAVLPRIIREGGFDMFIEQHKLRDKIREENKERREVRDMNKTGDFYSDYLESDYWKDLRKKALARDGGRCSFCGSYNDLNVHHNSYREKWQGIENELPLVMVLCKDCHSEFHERTEYFNNAHCFIPKGIRKHFVFDHENDPYKNW